MVQVRRNWLNWQCEMPKNTQREPHWRAHRPRKRSPFRRRTRLEPADPPQEDHQRLHKHTHSQERDHEVPVENRSISNSAVPKESWSCVWDWLFSGCYTSASWGNRPGTFGLKLHSSEEVRNDLVIWDKHEDSSQIADRRWRWLRRDPYHDGQKEVILASTQTMRDSLYTGSTWHGPQSVLHLVSNPVHSKVHWETWLEREQLIIIAMILTIHRDHQHKHPTNF